MLVASICVPALSLEKAHEWSSVILSTLETSDCHPTEVRQFMNYMNDMYAMQLEFSHDSTEGKATHHLRAILGPAWEVESV